ncbi:MAG TPA: hypothetical protein PL053_08990 [Deltaproteobacteria bacterium]|nr:hypothetical protein [Deltaproteobacteria bacterium]
MSFKDQLQSDLAVFINVDEFGELHTINGVQLNIVIDNDKLKERQAKAEYGYEGELLFYVPKAAYGAAPAIGQVITFNGDVYRVADVQENIGMYSITLTGNMA